METSHKVDVEMLVKGTSHLNIMVMDEVMKGTVMVPLNGRSSLRENNSDCGPAVSPQQHHSLQDS